MNEYALAQRVLEALGASEVEIPLPRIVARIPDALELLAREVSRDASLERRNLLRREFQVVVNGVTADLTPLLSGDDRLLLDSLKAAAIFEQGRARALVRLPDRASLEGERSGAFGYYALEGLTLHLKNVADGATLSFAAVSVPMLESLHEDLEPDLVARTAQLVSSAAPAEAAA
jgi:hypothetical protein